MEFEQLQRKYGGFYSPRFGVAVGGADEIREHDGLISDLSVDTTTEGADHFSFTLNHCFDRETGEFEEFDWNRFEPGAKTRISIGYAEREPVFVGRISSVRPNFPSGAAPTVAVSGYGLLHEMTRGTNSRSWSDATDEVAVSEVAGKPRYGFRSVEIAETGITYPRIYQERQSDFAFVKARADKNGYEVFARRDAFYFREPQYGREPIVTLRYGESLGSFSPEINNADQVESVEVRYWDPDAKEEIVGSAEREAPGTGKRVVRIPVESKAEADRIAEAALSGIAEGLVEGSGETVGIPEIQAGETLRLEGLGPRFSTTYYVTQATHRVNDSGYQTSFQVTERAI